MYANLCVYMYCVRLTYMVKMLYTYLFTYCFSENRMILASTILSQYTRIADRQRQQQTDRQTDRQHIVIIAGRLYFSEQVLTVCLRRTLMYVP